MCVFFFFFSTKVPFNAKKYFFSPSSVPFQNFSFATLSYIPMSAIVKKKISFIEQKAID